MGEQVHDIKELSFAKFSVPIFRVSLLSPYAKSLTPEKISALAFPQALTLTL